MQFKSAQLVSKYQIANNIVQLIFKPIIPETIVFEPGQFINIRVAEMTFRSYSISSEASNQIAFEILVNTTPDGVGSQFVKNLELLDFVEYVGPSGRFKLSQTSADAIHFLCTSTGIAPFISMLQYLRESKYKNPVYLYFGVRTYEDAFKLQMLEYFRTRMENFNYMVCFSDADVPNKVITEENVEIKHFANKGFVTDFFPPRVDKSKVNHFYLCGNPIMIDNAIKIIKDLGIDESCIFQEKFV